MINIVKEEACCGCSACSQMCPRNCISMAEDADGFLYPMIDNTACIQCDLCEKVCPVLQNPISNTTKLPKAYAAYNLNEDIRFSSSSGGVFSLIAEHILYQSGIIYGAAMNADGSVQHIRISTFEELSLLRGSKYVQSVIGQAYIQAKQDLESGKNVLFTGTPCQIEGLLSFLQKKYENLICMDIICHGVPSPTVWRKYTAYREESAESPAVQISFRHKNWGWKAYAVLFEFSNNTAYIKEHSEDLFMKAFLQDLCLRPSCYQCRFKKINRVSDITVADFWGIENVCPEMDDDKGTSLVIVHSEKGSTVFSGITQNMRYQEVDFSAAINDNPSMARSVRKPKTRDSFMQEIQTESFEKVVQKYAKKPYSVKGLIKTILSRLGLLNLAQKMKKKLM